MVRLRLSRWLCQTGAFPGRSPVVLPGRPFSAVTPDGRAIIGLGGHGQGAHTITVVDSRTEEAVGFGDPLPEESGLVRPVRYIALENDSVFWAVPGHRLRLERWRIDGELLGVYEPRAPWFPEEKTAEPWAEGVATASIRSRAVEATTGCIWITAHVPEDATTTYTGGEVPIPPEQVNRLFDFVTACLDLYTGAPVARARIDDMGKGFSGFLSAGRAYRIHEDPNGFSRYEIVRLRLVAGKEG